VAQQTLDFVIAQQVTGQADVARLIKSVGALDAEMQKLRSATQGMGAGFNQAAGAIRGNTNVLDAQSKALRNQRQGMQQVGMQINDFATSVSTGASITQAFNQQIGQLGYAMSMMGGTAGRVGTFLAGPWGAAVTVAVMVLGQLAEGFFNSGQSAEKASDNISKVQFASDATSTAQGILGGVLDLTTGKMIDQTAAAGNLARAQLEVARVQARIKMQEAQAALRTAASRTVDVGTERRLTGDRTGSIAIPIRRQTVSAAEAARALSGDVSKALDNLRALNDAGKITDQQFAEIAAAAANFGMEGENIKEYERALKALSGDTGALKGFLKPAKETAKSVREVKSEMDKFLESVGRVDERLDLAKEAFLAGKISAAQYRQEIERAKNAQGSFPKIAEGMIKVLRDGEKVMALPEMLQEVKTPKALQEIIDRNIEIVNSFEAVGMAVARGFQGMITGAQSFGDAMKGIINAVIEELFRLFVVQQIVGFFTKTLGGVTGVPTTGLPARALGGSVGQNKPYLVGERGPELFVPGKSGTIIPTQNTPNAQQSGGVTINVDARGSTDPEAVRRQVQQGILEAAPSIVAAAEQRTISTLRRPRLAGVM
jgi:hypothetical protein